MNALIRTNALFLVCIILVCATTSCSDGFVVPNVYGSISGTVVDRNTHEPIQNVLVTIKPSGQNTLTGYDGTFEFLDLEAHQYEVWAQKEGYATEHKTINVIAGKNEIVSLTMQ